MVGGLQIIYSGVIVGLRKTQWESAISRKIFASTNKVVSRRFSGRIFNIRDAHIYLFFQLRLKYIHDFRFVR